MSPRITGLRLEFMLVILVVGFFAFISYSADLSVTERQWFTDLYWTAVAFLAGFRCHLISTKYSGTRKKAWQYFAYACYAWFAGILIWDYLELIEKVSTPFPALSDLGFMMFAPLFWLGINQLSRQREITLSIIQISKFGVIVSSLIFVHLFLLLPAIQASDVTLFYITAALLYPVLYMTVTIYGLLLLTRSSLYVHDKSYLFLLSGLAVHAFTDTLYALSLIGKSYVVGNYLDIYWVIAFGLIYLGAVTEQSLGRFERGDAVFETTHVLEKTDALLGPASLLLLVMVVIIFADLFDPANLVFILPAFVFLMIFIAAHQMAIQNLQRKLIRKVETSDEKYKDMVSNVPGVVFQIVADRNNEISIPFVSASVRGLLGIDRSSLTQTYKSLLSLIPQEDFEQLLRKIQLSKTELFPLEWYGRINEKDRTVWLNARAVPRKQGDGTIEWNGILQDITEQKIASEILQRNNEGLEARVIERTRELREEVEKHRETSKELKRHHDLLTIISRLQSEYIGSGEFVLFFQKLLDHTLQITQSNQGFVGEVFYEDDLPALKIHAMSKNGWEAKTHSLFEKYQVENNLVFRNLDTLFGPVISKQQIIISNDVKTDFRALGVPNGHPTLNTFLGIPLISNERLIGMIGVANRVGGYSESFVDFLNPFFSACATIVAAYQNEEKRRLFEENLQTSEQRLKDAQQLGRMGDWRLDIQSEDLTWSAEVFNIFKQNVIDYKPSLATFYGFIHKDDIDAVRRAIDQAKNNINPLNIDYRIVLPDTNTCWVHQEAVCTLNENSEAVGLTGFIQDITERKNAEIALTIAKSEAERANEVKSEFMSKMSHELRTPLNAILGFSELLLMDQNLSALNRDSIEEINTAGKHLLELINELLDLARIESGKLKINPRYTNLQKIVNECRTILTPLAKQHEILMKFADFSQVNLYIDPLRFKQALLNLLSNAIKYNHPKGSVEIFWELKGRREIVIKVKDTGIGIPTEEFSRIFEPFERLKNKELLVDGTGIGLNITRELVEKMSGKIEVQSIEGQGSLFTLIFPIPQ